jgi:hypothetical protein
VAMDMSDHERYEELAALSISGFLSDQETSELDEHIKLCPECRKIKADFGELVGSGLPLTMGPVQEFLQRIRTRPDDGVRARFLQRATSEGIVFSAEVAKSEPQRADWVRSPVGVLAAAAAALLLVVGGTVLYRSAFFGGSFQSQQRIEQLQEQNSALTAQLSQLNQSLVTQQHEIDNLHTQLGSAARTAETLRQENEQVHSDAQRTSSQVVQFPAELANRDKQLEDARAEIQRINQLHATDEASLAAQQDRIAQISDQLRIASATLDMERQLTAAGKDIRELLTARQLHVIDVRDTDENGKPSAAFGRIFVTEGKSLMFYAFDLNEGRLVDAKYSFEVWGRQQAKGSPALKLGFLYQDGKAQRRWELKVNDPRLVQEVNSVFVTLEPSKGATAPSGQAMLFASLGQPNHI